jgi:hypothetical protein
MSKSLLFAFMLVVVSAGVASAHDGPFGWQMSPYSLPNGFAVGTDSYRVQQSAEQYFERHQQVATAPAKQPDQQINH